MGLLLDKHRLIISPALAPTHPREADHGDGPAAAEDSVLTIGLINNMPDAALEATERQFMRLLKAGAGRHAIHFHCFSLPSVARSEPARRRIAAHYGDIADLGRLPIDGLIVTGAEPVADHLSAEPFWHELTAVIDWAKSNTRSAIWSCLAAHAAVLHLDGIERHRLEAKCSGVYKCESAGRHWLTEQLVTPARISHSRLNELRESDLADHGYQLLTRSDQAGVDIFAREFEKDFQSQFIFFQGHPEYDTLSLQREYVRDIGRFLDGQARAYPGLPNGYFDPASEIALAGFEQRARLGRDPALMAALPKLRVRPDVAAGAAAGVLFKNWLEYLAATAKAIGR